MKVLVEMIAKALVDNPDQVKRLNLMASGGMKRAGK